MKGSKLLDNVREVIRTNHFSYSTEKTYIGWIYRYILFHNKRQIEKVKIRLEENMLLKGFTGASIPEALERKYPNAPKELAWQYIFPSRRPAIDPRSGKLKQHRRSISF